MNDEDKEAIHQILDAQQPKCGTCGELVKLLYIMANNEKFEKPKAVLKQAAARISALEKALGGYQEVFEGQDVWDVLEAKYGEKHTIWLQGIYDFAKATLGKE